MAFLAIGAALGLTGIAAGAVDFAVTIAATVGISYAAQALAGKPAATTSLTPGFSTQGTINTGGAVPRSFPLGVTNTAGSLVYVNTWGQIHPGGQPETPNAYLTQVIALSDLPGCGLEQFWVNGTLVTLSAEVDSPGTAITEYMIGAQPYLWIKYYDGTQTAADPFLTGTVASADRPYDGTRVGTGVGYAIVTALVNNTLFTGFPTFKFTLSGIPLYDPTKDSTNGGSGSQVFSNPATWGGDGNDLPAVQAYNVLRGISYNGAWFYGLQKTVQANLPTINWNAQIGKCRSPITGVSGPEPTYRSGGQVAVSSTPADLMNSLMTACQGKLSEVGGFYKVQLGTPDSFTFEFTDEDILSTEDQTYTPFLTLANSINGITGTYPDPTQAWNTTTAPPLYNATFEAQDGSRRLLANPTFDLVPFAEQVQRLMSSALAAARQERSHNIIMPPPFWAVEPGDVGRWNSARNGYVNKDFQVTAISDQANCDVGLNLLEIDPTSYNWDHGNFRAPTSGPTTFLPVPPQGIIDWFAVGTIINDSNGSPRRPAIALSWDGDMPGVVGIQYEVRLKVDSSTVTGGRTDQLAAGTILISESLLPNTLYQARGQYLPMAPRDMLWSDWLDVTTPNVLLTLADFDDSVVALVNGIEQFDSTAINTAINLISSTAANQDARNWTDKQEVRSQLASTIDAANAFITEVQTVSTAADAALATDIETVSASLGTLSATVTTNATAFASLSSAFSTYTVTTNAAIGSVSSNVTTNSSAIALLDGYAAASWSVTLDVNNYATGFTLVNGGLGVSEFIVTVDKFQIAAPGVTGGSPVPIFTVANIAGVPKIGIRADVVIDGSVTTQTIAAGAITTITLAAQAVTAAKIQAGSITSASGVIGALSVNSLSIGDNAVTVPVVQTQSGVVGPTTGLTTSSVTLTIDTTGLSGKPISIVSSWTGSLTYTGSGASPSATLIVDGASVQTVTTNNSQDSFITLTGSSSFTASGGVDTKVVSVSYTAPATGNPTLSQRTLWAMAAKR
jgi:hypothetical protein